MDGSRARHRYDSGKSCPDAECRICSEAAFILLENGWTEHYYTPQAGVRKMILEKYAGNKAVADFFDFARQEEELYRKYKAFYGYVFYIGKKI